MKDLVIYLKESRDIIVIITNYNPEKEYDLVLNRQLETAVVDSEDNYILTDEISRANKI